MQLLIDQRNTQSINVLATWRQNNSTTSWQTHCLDPLWPYKCITSTVSIIDSSFSSVLVSTMQWRICVFTMFEFHHHLITLVLDRQHTVGLSVVLLETNSCWFKVAQTEPYSKHAGHKTKTRSWKKLKSTAELGINAPGFNSNLVKSVRLHAPK